MLHYSTFFSVLQEVQSGFKIVLNQNSSDFHSSNWQKSSRQRGMNICNLIMRIYAASEKRHLNCHWRCDCSSCYRINDDWNLPLSSHFPMFAWNMQNHVYQEELLTLSLHLALAASIVIGSDSQGFLAQILHWCSVWNHCSREVELLHIQFLSLSSL